MKGLIIKDFINLKKSMILFGVISILYFFIGTTSDNPYFFTGMLSVILAITTISLFAYDDMAKWDAYALTMPISKESIIQGRYLMMLLLTLIGAVLSSVLTVMINIYLKKNVLSEGLNSIGIGALGIILFMCIVIPFVIKLGVERARIIFIAMYLIPFIIIMLLNKVLANSYADIPEWLIKVGKLAISNVYIIAPLTVTLALIISYFISIGIYRKKEL
jgi:hypothetical protein